MRVPPHRTLLATLAVLAAMPAAGAVRTFPGGGSCQSSLQACIDGAAPGDVVEIATNDPIDESLEVEKSLTLRAATGFDPVLAPLNSVLLLNADGARSTIVLEDLRLQRGFVSAVQASTQPFDVRIRGLVIEDTFNDRTEIEVRAGFPGPFGQVTFEVAGNDLTVPQGQFRGATAISIQGGSGASMRGVVRDNVVQHFDGGQNGAIEVSNGESTLDVDVVGNRISGADYNEGVSFFQFDDGDGRVRFVGNLVTGQVSEAGAPGAFVVNVTGGRGRFEIVNNTAAASDLGILVSARTDLGAELSGLIANNIVAGMRQSGVSIDEDIDVQNAFNLVFDTGDDFFVPGPGTLFVDPGFVAADDFHLRADSRAIDAGDTASVPAGIVADLDGLPRVVGVRVDLGAFERQDVVAGLCPGQPLATCRASGTSALRLRAEEGGVEWQWRAGATDAAELGDPTSTTDYALCLYDERDGAPVLVAQAVVPAGAGWKATDKGFKFRSGSGAPHGVRRLQLKAGAPGKASVTVAGRDVVLPPLPLAQQTAVVTQLVNDAGSCWTATFPAPAKRNDAARFSAIGQ